MRFAYYNTKTKEVIIREKYKGTLNSDTVELAVIENTIPPFNPDTQERTFEYVADVENKTYTKVWSVRDLTEYEIKVKDWEHTEYPIRIKAPEGLILDDIGIKFFGWWQIRELPIKKKEGFLYLYCYEIMEEHQPVFDDLTTQGLIEKQDRPND